MRPFRPQRFCLTLMNTSDGEAVFSYGPIAVPSRWARKLKDRIDRNWMEKYIPRLVIHDRGTFGPEDPDPGATIADVFLTIVAERRA